MSVIPHDPIAKLEENLFIVQGRLKRGPLDRKMTIVRLPGGDLFIHNAILLDDAGTKALDALGPVRTIFTPNHLHDLDGARMKDRYPQAKLCALPKVQARLRRKWPSLETLDPATLPTTLKVYPIPGLKSDECVLEVTSARGVTLVYTDSLFNMPHMPGASGLLLRALGASGQFGITKIGRMFLMGNRAAFVAYLREQSERTDVVRVVVAHGGTIEKDGVKGAFEGAAERA